MKIKILVCDYLGIALQFIEENFLKDRYEIITPPRQDRENPFDLLLKNSEWDYLLVFDNGVNRKNFDATFQFLGISDEKIIYAMNPASWLYKPEVGIHLANPTTYNGSLLYNQSLFTLARNSNRYITCTTAENLSYLATSGDGAVMYNTYVRRKTWAADDMDLFHRLTKKYYDIDDSSGYFCDWGANIGTTGIYFLKQLTPNLKLLAFEPDKENYKLLRINLLLNELEEKAVTENCGLGMEESEENFYRVEHNPGGSGMFANVYLSSINMEVEPEKIKIIPPDKYLVEKNISPEEIKYIWIDTEGFEAQVILGAKNLLEKNPAPIFMEFNPGAWNKSGLYEPMTEFLSRHYESYILVQEAEKTDSPNLYPIEKLLEFKERTEQIGDIFLIRKK